MRAASLGGRERLLSGHVYLGPLVRAGERAALPTVYGTLRGLPSTSASRHPPTSGTLSR